MAQQRRTSAMQGRTSATRRKTAQHRGGSGQRQGVPVQKSREELRREARLKRERQQKRKRRFTTCMLVLAAVVIGMILSLTVFFKINTIEVTGTSQYSKESILNVCGVDTGDNLFLIKKTGVAEKISRALPFTGEITVKRSFPNKIVIQVTDSVPSSAVVYEDGYALLNQDQKVLATVSTEEELYSLVAQQLYIAEETTAEETQTENNTEASTDTASQTKTDEEVEAAKSQIIMISGLTVSKAETGKKITFENNAAYTAYQDVTKALEEEEFTGVTGLDFSNSSDVRMEYEKRIILKLGSASGLNRKLQLAEKVLEEQNAVSTELTGTIDLTISGRAYFSDETESLVTTKVAEETSAVSEISESSTTS